MRVLDIAIKDLRLMLSDKKALAIMIMMPIILTSILSFALGGTFTSEDSIGKTKIAVVKKYNIATEIEDFRYSLSNGIVSENISKSDLEKISKGVEELSIEKIFFKDFLDNKDIKEFLEYEIVREDEALKLLNSKKISAIVILPENFIYDMYTNFLTPFRNKVEIKVITHPDMNFKGRIVNGIMESFTDMTSTLIVGKNVLIETALEEDVIDKVFNNMNDVIDDITVNLSNNSPEIVYESLNGRNPISSFSYYSAAMTSMFILFSAGYGGKSLLEEKDNITYQRMIIAGVSRWKILVGKFFTILAFTLIQIFVMVTFSTFVLKANWGNIYIVTIISILAAFAVAGLGTLIAVLTYKVGNYKMTNIFESGIIQVMAFVGGSFIPIDVLPKFIRFLSNLTINGLALNSYFRIMMGYGIGEILKYLALLVLIGIGLMFISIYLFREKERYYYVERVDAENYETA
ncbi:ABC transporter permease [Thermohalobacter berrensis]|uniref:ABC-2 type transporter transmembrane domain-containing protein n=1 Tax=Thermohalobacter berrensis TaxID=99594 RepID=A0A419T162_9FIRM|nr:ABC transporter permease [Thermohalobacter berrensis]RKD31202.1 hypothetical protein BET03_03485 [Thermohalobacter berrensis]